MKISEFFKPTDKQRQAFRLIGKGGFIFYGGARGGGKTHLIRGGGMLSATQFPGIRIVIVRKHYGELEEGIVDLLQEEYPPEIFKYRYDKKRRVFVFENGS